MQKESASKESLLIGARRLMPKHDCFTQICTFPDFDAPAVHVYTTSAYEAAEWVAAAWERDIANFRVIQGLETLRIRVEGAKGVSLWEVQGVDGRYIAKPMEGI